ncbi:MAG: 1-acyl-sn-glycerol-3-phosphate acyltransferase [Hymenobacteraceae bacterium]|nr:1-acyl-sn-glycerol-3-phosphate acyltransferase [Hymenobacteraceae bacterium]
MTASPLYRFFKLILQPSLAVFFQRIEVRGRENLLADGPILVVCNHPNTLMDPILVGMLWKRPLSFLAKSPFFRGIVGVVLRAAHAVPLYRKEDLAAKEGEAPAETLTDTEREARNEDAFRASFELLGAKSGALLIFPEGSSLLERRLRPLKTGAARIALGTEARYYWASRLKIVPIGLNYADAQSFRSRVFISIGEPLEIAPWREAYEADPFKAAHDLTDAIRQAMEAQLLITPSEEDDQFLRALETLYKPHLRATAPAELAGASAGVQDFELSRALIDAVAWFEARDPERVNDLRRRLLSYQSPLARPGLPDAPLRRDANPDSGIPGPAGQALAVVAGGPIWLWGAVNNYLPYWLPARIAERLTKEVEFVGPILMVAGMLTFPLFYALQTWAVWRFTGSGLTAGLYLLSLPPTGFFALAFSRWWAAWRGRWRIGWLGRQREGLLGSLREERTSLLAALEAARTDWRAGIGRV